eukprot:scaffold5949_cov101-Phaeocystis_antarctica.AAC.1
MEAPCSSYPAATWPWPSGCMHGMLPKSAMRCRACPTHAKVVYAWNSPCGPGPKAHCGPVTK